MPENDNTANNAEYDQRRTHQQTHQDHAEADDPYNLQYQHIVKRVKGEGKGYQNQFDQNKPQTSFDKKCAQFFFSPPCTGDVSRYAAKENKIRRTKVSDPAGEE